MAKENGAKFIYPAFGVTLRQNQREYFFNKVDKHFKGMSNKYIKEYGNSYKCGLKHVRKLWDVFKKECDKSNILYRMEDIIKDYKKEYEMTQMSLF